MKLYRSRFKKKDFDIMSIDEQICFIQAGRFINELSLFNKLIDYSRRGPAGEIEQTARNSQTLALLLILIGKLNECHTFLSKTYAVIRSKKDYEQFLGREGTEAYIKLTRYFSKHNNINNIRKKIAYHHDDDVIRRQLLKLNPDEEFEIYLADSVGNCIYHISNHIILRDLLERSDPHDYQAAFRKLILEVFETSNLFIDFLNDYVGVFAEKHGKHLPPLEELEIPDPQSIDEISLPYFVSKPLKT